MPKLTSDEEEIINVLTNLGTGELEPEMAAASLGLTLDELEALVTSHPNLVNEASSRAREVQNDPDATLQVSQQGLHSAAAALARRITAHADDLQVSELVAGAGLLEKLAGVAERRKLELKAALDSSTDKASARYPLVIFDNRTDKHRIFLITPESPHWVDTTDPRFQSPRYDWLARHAPLNRRTGEVMTAQLEKLLAAGGLRYLDEEGRLHGDVP